MKNKSAYVVVAFLIVVAILLFIMWGGNYSLNKDEIVITKFEECVAAGNVVMESYPRQCMTSDDMVFIEQIDDSLTPRELVFCTPTDRESDACIMIYAPVCTYDSEGNQISTYGNSCVACSDELVSYYIEGEC